MKKSRTWTLKVSKQLNKQVRDHIKKYNISLAAFVRKSVGYLLNEESVGSNVKNTSVLWLLQVHPELDELMRELAEANYPSVSALIRYAVQKQIFQEQSELTESNFKKKLIEDNYNLKLALRRLAKIYNVRHKDLEALGLQKLFDVPTILQEYRFKYEQTGKP